MTPHEPSGRRVEPLRLATMTTAVGVIDEIVVAVRVAVAVTVRVLVGDGVGVEVGWRVDVGDGVGVDVPVGSYT
jgi:hypothetical protein